MPQFRLDEVGEHKSHTLSDEAETGQCLSIGTGAEGQDVQSRCPLSRTARLRQTFRKKAKSKDSYIRTRHLNIFHTPFDMLLMT